MCVQKRMAKPQVLSYILYNYLRIDYIIVVKHPDDCHRSDRNVLVGDNNLRFSIFINVQY